MVKILLIFVKYLSIFVIQFNPMYYNLDNLSREELELLYITESQKLQAGIDKRLAYNILQSLRLNLEQINQELSKRSQLVQSAA